MNIILLVNEMTKKSGVITTKMSTTLLINEFVLNLFKIIFSSYIFNRIPHRGVFFLLKLHRSINLGIRMSESDLRLVEL